MAKTVTPPPPPPQIIGTPEALDNMPGGQEAEMWTVTSVQDYREKNTGTIVSENHVRNQTRVPQTPTSGSLPGLAIVRPARPGPAVS